MNTDTRPMTITVSEVEPSDRCPRSNTIGMLVLVLRASAREGTGSVLRYTAPTRARTGPVKRYLLRVAYSGDGSPPDQVLEERKRPMIVTTRATARNVSKRNG